MCHSNNYIMFAWNSCHKKCSWSQWDTIYEFILFFLFLLYFFSFFFFLLSGSPRLGMLRSEIRKIGPLMITISIKLCPNYTFCKSSLPFNSIWGMYSDVIASFSDPFSQNEQIAHIILGLILLSLEEWNLRHKSKKLLFGLQILSACSTTFFINFPPLPPAPSLITYSSPTHPFKFYIISTFLMLHEFCIPGHSSYSTTGWSPVVCWEVEIGSRSHNFRWIFYRFQSYVFNIYVYMYACMCVCVYIYTMISRFHLSGM